MQKNPTSTADEDGYEAFLNGRVRTVTDLAAGYAAMAADEQSEREAQEWVDGLIDDLVHGLAVGPSCGPTVTNGTVGERHYD